MNDNLRPVVLALEQLEDTELRALMDAASEMAHMAMGFLSWIEHIADWELNRRAGLESPLKSPYVAIRPEEDGRSIAAAMMMHEQIAERSEARSMAALFDAVLDALTGRQSLH